MDKYVKLRDIPKGKRWEHYWSYYKVHTFIGIFLFLLGAMLIKDVFFQEKADLLITVATTRYSTTEATDELNRVLNSYGRDYNGNNHKLLEIHQITMSTDANADMQMVIAAQTKLVAQFQDTNAAIFLMDEDIYNYLRSDEDDVYADLVQALGEDAAPYVSEDNLKIYLKELPALKDNELIQSLPDLFFVIRDEANLNRKNKPEVAQVYQNNLDFLRNLLNNDAEEEVVPAV